MLAGALALTLLLAACSTPPTTATPEPGIGITRVHYQEEDTIVLAAGLGLVDTDHEEPAPMSVTPIGQGLYIGPVSGMGPDFRVLFPAGADVPGVTLSPATNFITLLTTECTTQSSNAAARVSEVFWFLFTAPAIIGVGPQGRVLSVTSNQALDVDGGIDGFVNVPFVSWVYANQPTVVTTPEEGCAAGTINAQVNLTLDRGWNQVEVMITPDPDSAGEYMWTLQDSDIEELHVTFLADGLL